MTYIMGMNNLFSFAGSFLGDFYRLTKSASFSYIIQILRCQLIKIAKITCQYQPLVQLNHLFYERFFNAIILFQQNSHQAKDKSTNSILHDQTIRQPAVPGNRFDDNYSGVSNLVTHTVIVIMDIFGIVTFHLTIFYKPDILPHPFRQ